MDQSDTLIDLTLLHISQSYIFYLYWQFPSKLITIYFSGGVIFTVPQVGKNQVLQKKTVNHGIGWFNLYGFNALATECIFNPCDKLTILFNFTNNEL